MNAMTLETAIRERLRPEGEQPFAVIDFDNTCIVNDIGEAALAFMCENRLLRYGGLLSAEAEPCNAAYHERVFRHYHQILAQGDIHGASLLCARIFAGFRREEAAALVAATLAAEGTLLGERELYGLRVARGLAVRAALRALIDFAAANRIGIWIVSASPAIAVDAAMRRFGIAGKLIALRHRVESGILSSAIEEPCSIAEGKVDCIKAFIDPRRRPLLAVGDSDYDLPMIEYAELHAVVDRNNALTQKARQRGWFVLPS
jgi:phosphoserine phosphatase